MTTDENDDDEHYNNDCKVGAVLNLVYIHCSVSLAYFNAAIGSIGHCVITVHVKPPQLCLLLPS